MNHFNEIDNGEGKKDLTIAWSEAILFVSLLVNNHEDNVNISSDERISMESDQPTSVMSRSPMDDDIVEIEGL